MTYKARILFACSLLTAVFSLSSHADVFWGSSSRQCARNSSQMRELTRSEIRRCLVNVPIYCGSRMARFSHWQKPSVLLDQRFRNRGVSRAARFWADAKGRIFISPRQHSSVIRCYAATDSALFGSNDCLRLPRCNPPFMRDESNHGDRNEPIRRRHHHRDHGHDNGGHSNGIDNGTGMNGGDPGDGIVTNDGSGNNGGDPGGDDGILGNDGSGNNGGDPGGDDGILGNDGSGNNSGDPGGDDGITGNDGSGNNGNANGNNGNANGNYGGGNGGSDAQANDQGGGNDAGDGDIGGNGNDGSGNSNANGNANGNPR